MARGLWEKLEHIREQPEHIRMRYVLGCLFVSMTFILGIWLLSLKESFKSITHDVPAATEKGKELLPADGTTSLNDLLKGAVPMRIDDQAQQTGKEYFEEQFRTQKQKDEAEESPVVQPSTP